MRLIDADKLIEKLEALADSYFDINCSDFTIGVYNICRQQGVDAAIEVVKKQEPIDTVKHGEWVSYPTLTSFLRCNQCRNGIHWDDNKKPNYCPNCGAKMQQPKEC